GGGLVDGHHDGAGGPDGVVDERPLVAGMRHDRHPVAGGDAGGDQPLGERLHLVSELAGGDVFPGAARALAAQRDGTRLLRRATGDHLGHVRCCRDVRQRRNAVLAHDLSVLRLPESMFISCESTWSVTCTAPPTRWPSPGTARTC